MDTARVIQYLKRIEITLDLNNVKPDYDLLCRLQYAHVTHIPYENLDIIRRMPLNLSLKSLFNKIITHRRGGYCFELNSLFNWLLCQLGYTTENYFARYLRGEKDIPMRRHRVIAAKSPFLDSPILCDVGIGERAPRYPLRIEPDIIQEQFGETYQLTEDEAFGWVITDLHKGSWNVFYAFTEEKQFEIDYDAASFWCENYSDSPFRNKIMVSLKTDLGRKTISGMSYRVFEAGDIISEFILDDQNDLYRTLADEFGIIY